MSFLVVDNQKIPFSNLQTLLEQTHYKIAVYPGSSAQSLFEDSESPFFRKAWHERISPYMSVYKKFKDKWTDVIDPDVALVDSKAFMQYVLF